MELTFTQSTLLAANAAWWVGFSRVRAGWPWTRCVGAALVAFPLARLALRLLDLPLLFQSSARVGAASTDDLLRSLLVVLVFNLVAPSIGLAIALGRGDRMRRASEFLGFPRRSIRIDLLDGQTVIGLTGVVFLVGFLAAGRLRSSGLLEGPSPLFDRAGTSLLLALTLVAGVTEEFLFRGVVQNVLRRRMGELPAVAAQAVAFGLAHTGQGGLVVVLGPAALGLAAGLVAARLGLLAAILLHAETDLAYFALTTKDPVLLTLAAGLWAVGAGLLLVRGRATLRSFLTSRRPSATAHR